MADQVTPVLGLIKPNVGGDGDLWGEMLNTNSDTIDAAMGAVEAELATKQPIGNYAAAVHTHPISQVDNLQQALDAKAPLNSPQLTGNPTAPTAMDGDYDTSIANTTFVQRAIGISTPDYIDQPYRLVATDVGRTLRLGPNCGAIYLPICSTINWPYGGRVDIMNQGGATVNFYGDSGVSVYHTPESLAQMSGAWKGATIQCIDPGSSVYVLMGDLVSA